ncbi:MAG TPA: GNAT family N-acetyltransferase [Actinophytocola sp.]|uniref:GNAT family N-acetyltransferase n=1 Tax=Actinophytocola sp. TaxID=1872138 RepID=UPI002DBADDCD|nr:GNAT family N-acetyltransferase [Actinophytocola sp.]HEU5469704.1 GNAT family N-acetyltransferase [Actinophytocola sp.]
MSVRLRPMTDEELSAWIPTGLDRFIAELVAYTGEPEEVIRQRSAPQFAEYFPDGRPAPRHELFVIEAAGVRVGTLWVGPHPIRPHTPEDAWLYNISIDEHARRRGHAREALRLAETQLSGRGVTTLWFNVFASNSAARALYRVSGYDEISVTMAKGLASPGAGR